MGHIQNGLTGASAHRGDTLRPSGWRKVSEATLRADAFAEAGQGAQVDKGRAIVALKRVGAHLGLKAADLLLIDTLAAFTQPQDWETGRRPIVWASNAYLMEKTGFSLSALKRHARRLVEYGVISFQDSPNGKRWGHRDADGVIVEAYGFDLSPLAARVSEFDALHAELEAERALCQRLKRQITVVRRMIRAALEAAMTGQGPWSGLQAMFEDLLASLPRRAASSDTLSRVLSHFTALRDRIEAILSPGSSESGEEETSKVSDIGKQTRKMDPREVISDPHIRITKDSAPVTCNSSKNEEAAAVERDDPPEAPVDRELEEWVTETRKRHGPAVDLATVMQACPEFATWARTMGGYLRDWGDLHRIAGQLRPMIGISEPAWTQAQTEMGPQMATAALVLVFDKHCAGEVASPGGYLRGMIEKAGAGELHLERSFYGRLNGVAA